MMIGRSTLREGEEFLLLGLSRTNIDRLVAGDPIRISRKTHGDGVPDGMIIAIMFGETEMALRAELLSQGAIEATQPNIDPRLK